MQDKERETLKANAEQLANLLTENVPYLLGHYLQNGVLTESEREDIIQGESAQEIRIKLVRTLAAKEGVSLKAVIEGLNATENQCVSKEIENLLSEVKTGEEVADNGSGDKTEDLSTYATNLVDEVIAKAEKTTAEQAEPEREDERMEEEHQEEIVVEVNTKQPTSEERGEPSTTNKDDVEENSADEVIADKLVETSVEVHTTNADAQEEKGNNENGVGGVDDDDEPVVQENHATHESIADVNNDELGVNKDDDSSDAPDRSVNFSESVATIIEDGKHNNQFEEQDVSASPSPVASPITPNSSEYHSHGLDTQNESENEDDVDNIDIEKEFVMPAEAETNINNNNISDEKVTNGKGANLVRMESNDIVLDDGKPDEENKSNGENGVDDSELAAVLARKALVKQQVELFEKNSPAGTGKIKYSFRTASQDNDAQNKTEGTESKVKNLKNFFQRLSTDTTTSSPPSGPTKSVGKLKVTFPASS